MHLLTDLTPKFLCLTTISLLGFDNRFKSWVCTFHDKDEFFWVQFYSPRSFPQSGWLVSWSLAVAQMMITLIAQAKIDKKAHQLLLSLSDFADCNSTAVFLVALDFRWHEFECRVILSGWPIQTAGRLAFELVKKIMLTFNRYFPTTFQSKCG